MDGKKDLFSQVNCTYCQEEINGVRVQCCDCVDFDICLQCFSSGAEIGPHKNDHPYRFMDHCAVSVFGGRGNWTGREQLLLLDAVELYGFGNWELISRHVETRTPEEVKEEYIQRYVEGNIGKATLTDDGSSRPILQEHITEDKGPLSPEVTSRLPPLDVTPEEARQLGYMSHRDDYEREYDMAAEQLVSSLHLNSSEDSGMETALKLAQVGMYIRRLRERYRRKRVVRDYQLVAKFFANQRNKDSNKKPLTKEQKELRDKMRVFSQFLTSGEHERLIASIERERELRHRLSELMRYRSVGLTTQDEIIHYEQHVEYQRQQKLKQKAGGSGLVTSIPDYQLKNGKDPSQNLIDEKWLQNVESESNTFCPTSNSDSVVPPPPSTLPHGSLLSQHEAELCSTLNIQPVQYITMKSLIIQDNLTTGKTKIPDDLNTTEEANIRDVVTQYLNISGWLSVV